MIVDVDRPPFEDGRDELEMRHVGPPPRPVDREEPEHRRRDIIEMGIGMRDALACLLGGSIDGQLRVGLVRLGIGHVRIRAIDGRGRCHQEMPHPVPPCRLVHVERPGHVRVDIGARRLEAVAHARLPGEMHDHLGRAGIDRAVKRIAVLEHRPGRPEARRLQQYLLAALLEPDVVVIGHPVEAMHLVPFIEKEPGKVKPDETCSTGDEDAHGGTERRPQCDVKPEMPHAGTQVTEPLYWTAAPIC